MKLRSFPTLETALLLSSMLLLPLATEAATITGGATTVTFDTSTLSVLTGAGFAIAPVSPATLATSPAVAATFPITGRDTATNITHSGGLTLTRGTTSASLTNFNINLTSSTLSGMVTAGGSSFSNVALFDISSSNGSTLLSLDPALATQINAVFSVPLAAGTPIGAASVAAVTATPEPGSWALAGMGVVALAAAIRFRRSPSIA